MIAVNVHAVSRLPNNLKRVTVREFYQHSHLVDGLAEGKQPIVTANGKTKFVVIKSSRAKMSRELAEKRAIGGSKAPSFNRTAFLASLKKRDSMPTPCGAGISGLEQRPGFSHSGCGTTEFTGGDSGQCN